MKRHKHWWEGIGLVLGILALILVARALLNVQPPAASEPAESTVTVVMEASSSATVEAAGTLTVAPTQVPTATVAPAEATAIPLCSFAVPTQTEPTSESLLDAYVFSEPRVVLTGSTPIEVVEWVSDGETLLVTRYVSNGIESLEMLNIHTGQNQLYAQRQSDGSQPIWMSTIEGIVYSGNLNQQPELQVSYGNPQATQSLSLDVDGFAVTRYGTRLIFFSQKPNMLHILDLHTRSTEDILMNLEPIFSNPTQDLQESSRQNSFEIAWRFGYEQVVLYGRTGAFLVDMEAQAFCEINLTGAQDVNRTILGAEWSQDGHYLAMMGTAPLQYGQLPSFSELVVLDANDGESFDLNLGILFVGDMAWSPDNKSLAVLGLEKEQSENGKARLMLLTVDVVKKEYSIVFPGQRFGNFGIEWGQGEHNDSFIALACPVWPREGEKWITEQRICVVNVTQSER